MTRLVVWGTSDDLIEVREVDGYPDSLLSVAEYGRYDTSPEAPVELHFSDGSILNVWYGDCDAGIWRVEISHQGTAGIVIVPAESENGIYTDVAFVTGPDIALDRCVCEGEEDQP